MSKGRSRSTRWFLTLAAAVSGGSLCGDCQTTFRDAAVSGAQSYILNDLLNPANYVDSLVEDGQTDGP